MKKVFEAWAEVDAEGSQDMMLAPADVISEMMDKGLLSRKALLKFSDRGEYVRGSQRCSPHQDGMVSVSTRWGSGSVPKSLRSITRKVQESVQTAVNSR